LVYVKALLDTEVFNLNPRLRDGVSGYKGEFWPRASVHFIEPSAAEIEEDQRRKIKALRPAAKKAETETEIRVRSPWGYGGTVTIRLNEPAAESVGREAVVARMSQIFLKCAGIRSVQMTEILRHEFPHDQITRIVAEVFYYRKHHRPMPGSEKREEELAAKPEAKPDKDKKENKPAKSKTPARATEPAETDTERFIRRTVELSRRGKTADNIGVIIEKLQGEFPGKTITAKSVELMLALYK